VRDVTSRAGSVRNFRKGQQGSSIGINGTDGETSPNMPPKYPSVSPSIGPTGAQAGLFICGLRQEALEKEPPASRRQGTYSGSHRGGARRAPTRKETAMLRAAAVPARRRPQAQQQLRPAANVLVRSKCKRCSGNKVIEVAFFRCRIFKLNVAPLRTPAG
jgi:hypothetical protein